VIPLDKICHGAVFYLNQAMHIYLNKKD